MTLPPVRWARLGVSLARSRERRDRGRAARPNRGEGKLLALSSPARLWVTHSLDRKDSTLTQDLLGAHRVQVGSIAVLSTYDL